MANRAYTDKNRKANQRNIPHKTLAVASVTVKDRPGKWDIIGIIIRGVIAFLGTAGAVSCFLTAADIARSLSAVITAFIACGVFTALCCCFHENSKLVRTILLCGFGAIALFCLVIFKRLYVGVTECINRFCAIIIADYQDNPFFTVSTDYDTDFCVSLALCTLTVIMAYILCAALIRHTSLILTLAVMIPLPEVCLYFGLSPNGFSFAILLFAVAGAVICEITEFNVNFFSKPASSQCALCGSVIIALCYAVSVLGSMIAGYERPELLDEIRNSTAVYIENFSWEKLSDDIRTTLPFYNSGTATHDGKLGSNSEIEFTGEHLLSVTLPVTDNTVYLKGFTGVEYTGTRWEEYTDTTALETKLTSSDFFVGRMYPYFCGDGDMNAAYMFIQNVSVSDSVRYIPSNSAGMIEATEQGRRYAAYFPSSLDWRSSIIAAASKGAVTDETLAADELALRETAYSECLDVPDTFHADDFFDDYSGETVEEELIFIREKLADICDYTLSTEKRPFGRDFADWFLNDSQEGSCTHFATAAVLLCRMRGIPARYCEGFVIKLSDMLALGDTGDVVTLAVSDSRAHAWIEVYIDNYGWLTYEVTPGYGGYSSETDSWESTVTEVVKEEPEIETQAPLVSVAETSHYTEMTTNPTGENEAIIGGEETAVTTTVATEQETTETAAPSRSDDGEYGSDNEEESANEETVPPASEYTETYSPSEANDSADDTESEKAASTAADSGNDTEEEDSALFSAVLGVLGRIAAIIVITAALIGVVILRRRAILAYRRKMVRENPDKAAVRIYRMLIKSARSEGIAPELSEPEKIPAYLSERSERFPLAECRIIVNTALAARFGGGADVHSAEKAYSALNGIRQGIYENESIPKKLADKWIAVNV